MHVANIRHAAGRRARAGSVYTLAVRLCHSLVLSPSLQPPHRYDDAPADRFGVKNLFRFVIKQLTMEGFLIFPVMYDPAIRPIFFTEMGDSIANGQVKVVETVTQGIEHAGEAFCNMMGGLNLGKAVVVL